MALIFFRSQEKDNEGSEVISKVTGQSRKLAKADSDGSVRPSAKLLEKMSPQNSE